MRSISFLVLSSLLGILLTSCPAAGPALSFTGTYRLVTNPREAAQRPEALRGGQTLTAVLIQAGMSVTGTLTSEPGDDGTITATISAPGQAAGSEQKGRDRRMGGGGGVGVCCRAL